ncbi:MAG: hypothetical protein Q8Q32_01120 [bacterium]|nr:hypothetical protein [bacterium]
MKKLSIVSASILLMAMPKLASAHCPLCTIGAGALAVFAASIGVSSVVVGILFGAFSVALSLWMAGIIERKWKVSQREIVAAVIFLSTILPIMPLIKDYGPFYLAIAGEYGNLLHRTYTVNLFVLGVIFGSVLMLIGPYFSRVLTKIRGKQFPFQGISITLLLLIIVSTIVQILS